jgi:hypothetical protein
MTDLDKRGCLGRGLPQGLLIDGPIADRPGIHHDSPRVEDCSPLIVPIDIDVRARFQLELATAAVEFEGAKSFELSGPNWFASVARSQKQASPDGWSFGSLVLGDESIKASRR